jgi:hypothetical protein
MPPATCYCAKRWNPPARNWLSGHFELFQLSKLSVWWLRLGITTERIQPGHPQQNGRHERMHLTLKQQATRPAGANILQQQGKFDAFLEEFNRQRPHEALSMQCPAENLHGLATCLHRYSRTTLPLPRSYVGRHQLWPAVPVSQEDQSQHISRRSGRGRQRSR